MSPSRPWRGCGSRRGEARPRALAHRRVLGLNRAMLRFDQAGRGYHACREWHPRPDEAAYVELLFHQAYPQPHVAAGESWRVVPDASAHLLFVTYASTASGSTREPTLRLVGARSQYADIDLTGRTTMVGLRLRPGVLGSLIGHDARYLTDRSVSAEDVFGKAAPMGPELFGKEGPAVARLVNDWIVGIAKQHPTRFFGLCVLPLQDMQACLAELRW